MEEMGHGEAEQTEDEHNLRRRTRSQTKSLTIEPQIEKDNDAIKAETSHNEPEMDKKRKNHESDNDDFDDRLDDDDYDLLEENLGVKIDRKKRYKRLKRLKDDQSEDENEPEDKEAIAMELFDEREVQESECDRAEDLQRVPNSEAESSEDDFIVDNEGNPVSQRPAVYEDSCVQEAREIFGINFDYKDFEQYDESEEDEESPNKAIHSVRKSIFDIYEPAELQQLHFTDLDSQIRGTDVPERQQLRPTPLTDADADELESEAEWIYSQMFGRKCLLKQSEETNDATVKPAAETTLKIQEALGLMRNQKFEVPFIAHYRKEFISPGLDTNDLWRVYRLDAKWCELQLRKQNFLALFGKMSKFQQLNQTKSDVGRLISDEDIMRIDQAQSSEELNDIYHHFMLYYSQDIPAMQAVEREEEPEDVTKVKHAVRTGPYTRCRKAGLHKMAEKFGLTPEQFAENLQTGYQRHEVRQEESTPSALAQEFLGAQFSTAEEVLKAAQLMVAIEIARHPLVRRLVREAYFGRAKLSVRPTRKGVKEIDEAHAVYAMKYLKDKPVREMQGDQFLRLVMAEEDKLVTIHMSDNIHGTTSDNYIEEVKQLYVRNEISTSVIEWNDMRSGSVELALTKMLIPDLKTDLRTMLLAEAKEYVLGRCRERVRQWLNVAPYVRATPVDEGQWGEEDEGEKESDKNKGLTVMAVAYVSDYTQAAFACIVGPDGKVTDHLRMPHLMKRKFSHNEEEKAQRSSDLEALSMFIVKKRPHLIVVSGESRQALMVVEDIKECVSNCTVDQHFPNIPVEIIDNNLATVYSQGNLSTEEFRDYPHVLLQAVSLARRMLDPLEEFCQLCTSDNDILCLQIHPLQKQLAKDDLLEALHEEFINRVNDVGVDLSRLIKKHHAVHVLQFVSGLGPRKALALIKLLKQTSLKLENRSQLVSDCHMGPKIFMNCVAFIKINTRELDDETEQYIDVLDSTRVHPESYEWARKMAVDALECEDDDTAQATAVETVMAAPEKLLELDLDTFAEELQKLNYDNRSATLHDICAELTSPYKDRREAYRPPSEDELFMMLTRETPETLYVGKLVVATVVSISHRKPEGDGTEQANPTRNDESGMWQCPYCLKDDFLELSDVWNHYDDNSCPGPANGVRIRLENGLPGFIHVKNLSDNFLTSPEEKVTTGQAVECRIRKIQVDRFNIECTAKPTHILDEEGELKPPKDPFYDAEAEEREQKAARDRILQRSKQTYIKRVIVHPCFFNISFVDCEKQMATKNTGEAIIRPSSKGSDHLTVTWKVTDGIHQHIDVREEGKANSFSLGQILWIGNEEFEDLDEIIVRHINPMASYVFEMLEFRYYKPDVRGDREKAEEVLKERKEDEPTRIPYIVSAIKDRPGRFLLSYMPRAQCVHEPIKITPAGYLYRNQTFTNSEELIRYFKEHFREPIPKPEEKPAEEKPSEAAETPTETAGDSWDNDGAGDTWDTEPAAAVDDGNSWDEPSDGAKKPEKPAETPDNPWDSTSNGWGDKSDSWGSGGRSRGGGRGRGRGEGRGKGRGRGRGRGSSNSDWGGGSWNRGGETNDSSAMDVSWDDVQKPVGQPSPATDSWDDDLPVQKTAPAATDSWDDDTSAQAPAAVQADAWDDAKAVKPTPMDVADSWDDPPAIKSTPTAAADSWDDAPAPAASNTTAGDSWDAPATSSWDNSSSQADESRAGSSKNSWGDCAPKRDSFGGSDTKDVWGNPKKDAWGGGGGRRGGGGGSGKDAWSNSKREFRRGGAKKDSWGSSEANDTDPWSSGGCKRPASDSWGSSDGPRKRGAFSNGRGGRGRGRGRGRGGSNSWGESSNSWGDSSQSTTASAEPSSGWDDLPPPSTAAAESWGNPTVQSQTSATAESWDDPIDTPAAPVSTPSADSWDAAAPVSAAAPAPAAADSWDDPPAPEKVSEAPATTERLTDPRTQPKPPATSSWDTAATDSWDSPPAESANAAATTGWDALPFPSQTPDDTQQSNAGGWGTENNNNSWSDKGSSGWGSDGGGRGRGRGGRGDRRGGRGPRGGRGRGRGGGEGFQRNSGDSWGKKDGEDSWGNGGGSSWGAKDNDDTSANKDTGSSWGNNDGNDNWGNKGSFRGGRGGGRRDSWGSKDAGDSWGNKDDDTGSNTDGGNSWGSRRGRGGSWGGRGGGKSDSWGSKDGGDSWGNKDDDSGGNKDGENSWGNRRGGRGSWGGRGGGKSDSWGSKDGGDSWGNKDDDSGGNKDGENSWGNRRGGRGSWGGRGGGRSDSWGSKDGGDSWGNKDDDSGSNKGSEKSWSSRGGNRNSWGGRGGGKSDSWGNKDDDSGSNKDGENSWGNRRGGRGSWGGRGGGRSDSWGSKDGGDSWGNKDDDSGSNKGSEKSWSSRGGNRNSWGGRGGQRSDSWGSKDAGDSWGNKDDDADSNKGSEKSWGSRGGGGSRGNRGRGGFRGNRGGGSWGNRRNDGGSWGNKDGDDSWGNKGGGSWDNKTTDDSWGDKGGADSSSNKDAGNSWGNSEAGSSWGSNDGDRPRGRGSRGNRRGGRSWGNDGDGGRGGNRRGGGFRGNRRGGGSWGGNDEGSSWGGGSADNSQANQPADSFDWSNVASSSSSSQPPAAKTTAVGESESWDDPAAPGETPRPQEAAGMSESWDDDAIVAPTVEKANSPANSGADGIAEAAEESAPVEKDSTPVNSGCETETPTDAWDDTPTDDFKLSLEPSDAGNDAEEWDDAPAAAQNDPEPLQQDGISNNHEGPLIEEPTIENDDFSESIKAETSVQAPNQASACEEKDFNEDFSQREVENSMNVCNDESTTDNLESDINIEALSADLVTESHSEAVIDASLPIDELAVLNMDAILSDLLTENAEAEANVP